MRWWGWHSTWAMLSGPTARKSAAALVAQGLLSATNFVIGLILARLCSKEEFGIYVLAYSVLLAANGLQAALISRPMTVLSTAYRGGDWDAYMRSMAVAQLILGVTLAITIAGLSVCLRATGVISSDTEMVFLAMSVALFFVQAQEFSRRRLYAGMRAWRVLMNDTCYCLLQLGGIVLLWKLGGGAWGDSGAEPQAGYVSAKNAFACLAVAGGIGALLGLWPVGGLVAKPQGMAGHARETWGYGRWRLLDFASGTLCGQAQTWLIGAMLGTATLGGVESARLVLAPLQIMTLGLPAVLLPRAAHLFAQDGHQRLRRFMARLAPVWLILLGAYVATAIVAPGFFLHAFFGAKYADMGLLVIMWSGIYLFLGVAHLPNIALDAMRRPDMAVKASLPANLLALGLTACAIPLAGAEGALAARLIGAVLALVAACWLAARLLKGAPIGTLPVAQPCCGSVGRDPS
ncbi:MAG TPA: oligosaccharide flippase family protein [Planctomycetota bacterium]|nr:oligosaccharide flippase family protein [Planctomycetota bacterium]